MKINRSFARCGRKIISVALCLVMMFTTFFIFEPSVLKITASAAAWSGSTSATSGTDYTISGSTMHIKTPNGLAWFMNNLGKYASYTVYLDNDIDLGGSNQWVRKDTEFKGIFDGQDHTISKMNAYCGYREDLAGLFLKANGAQIRNLKFDNCFVGTTDTSYGKDTWYGKYGLCVGYASGSKVTFSNITVTSSRVSGRTRIGGLIGECETDVEFTNCNVSCRVTGVRFTQDSDKSLTYWTGGYVGRVKGNLTATNCTYSNATHGGETSGVVGRQQSGGIVGLCENGQTFKIENCYNSASINNSGRKPQCAGGLAGEVKVGTIQIINCSNTGNVSNTGSHTGGLIGYSEGEITISGKLSSQSYTNNGTISGSSCVGGTVGFASGASSLSFTNCTNNGTVSASETDAGGILGKTEGYVKTFSNCHNTGAITATKTTAGGMCGYVKGGNRGSTVMKIVGCINTGAIKSINSDFVGGMVGSSEMPINMTDCNNSGSITGQQYVGGLIASCKNGTISITNSNNTGEIWGGHKHIGGIIGYAVPSDAAGITIRNCSNSAKSFFARNENIGGIIGKNDSNNPLTLENCHNTSTLNVKANWIGGLVGYDKGKLVMRNCTNTANITGYQHTAGLIAGIEDDGCEITNCLNTGNVSTSNNSNASGILATIQGQTNSSVWTIKNVVNTGTVEGAAAVGGFVGYMGHIGKKNIGRPITIENCVNKGMIAATGVEAGGFVGNMQNHGSSTQHHKYTNCYNYGNISSNSGSTDGVFVGGIVGKEYGFAEFSGCRNYGTVNASNTSANSISGGICGWIEDDTSSFADCINYGNVTAKNNIGGILGEVSNAYNGTSFSFTQCGNYGSLSATTNNFADMGGIVGKLWAKERTVKIYMSKCFNGNGNGNDGRIASVSYKAKNAGGLFGEVNQQAVIADSYNNASSISSSTNAGGLIGTNNGNTTLAYNSFSVTESVSNLAGSGSVTQYGCFTNTMGKGTAALATLNTNRSVSGISSVGNAYDYKQGVNKDYPALKWQLNTLTKNVGRNLMADLIADTAKSGYSAQGSSYSIKLDGITKTYYPTYTKTVNGITVTYSTLTETFTLSGTPTATGSFNILSVSNPEAKSAFASAYYVGGKAMGCSATVFSTTIGRTGKVHALKSVSAGETVNVSVYVTPNVPVQFDNYKFHASMDYVNNVTATSDALVDLHSTYSGLGTPTKKGYKFLGWYTVRAKGDAITDGSTVVNSGTPSFDDTLDRDVDIYAHWDPISYTIRYNGNGSTGGSTGISVHIYDEAKNLTANGFYRKFDVNLDYCNGRETETLTATSEFLGWATSENGNKVYEDKRSVKNLTAEDGKIIDLYAKWADSSVELPTPTRTGYTFDGWYTSDGTKVSQTFTPTAATKLTAHWTPITYTVSYNGNGATSGETASSSHTYDVAKALTANGFKREFTVTFDYNYSGSTTTTATAVSNFNGWAKTATGAAEYSDGASVTNLSLTDGEKVILYANWTDSTVKFPTPTRTGYDFSGWYNEAGQKVEETTVISEDITLHAQWSIKSYTVTFKNGDDVLQESKWEYNTTPTYNGATPTKSKDDSYEYTFSGWTPEISAVKDDIAYYAQYSKTAHDYRCDILDGKQHQYVCNDCDYKKAPEKHKLVYVKTDNGYSYTCSECGYSYTTIAKAYAVEFSCNSYSAANNAYIKSECEKYAAANPPVYNEAKSKNYYIATIKAPMTITENGQKMYFVYWLDAETGEKVGTYTTYRYFQTKSSKFTPVYATQQEYYAMRNQAVIASRVVDCRLNDNGSYSLLAEHSVASSCESIKGHGVIYTTEAANAGILTTDNDNVEKKAALKSANALTGLLEVSVDLHGANTVWARTYVIDANNEVHYGTVRQFDVTAGTSSAGDEIITLGAESYDLTDLNSDAEAPTIEDEPTEKSPLEILKTVFSKLIEIINEIISYFTKPGAKK